MDKSDVTFGSGTRTGSFRGSLGPSECGSRGSVDGAHGDAEVILKNMKKNKNEILLSHKTKVSQVKPPERIVYEWEWDITKFDKAFPLLMSGSAIGKSKVLKSEKIRAGADIGRKSVWLFAINEANGKLSWYVRLEKINKSSTKLIHTAFTFKVVDASGKELFHKPRCFGKFKEGMKHGWDDWMDLEKLYEQKDIFLTENTLRIRILFEMFVDPDQSQLEAAKQEKDNFAKLMTTDMWRLRSTTGTADVHLECEGKVFPVHKLILSARSGAFSKMFGATVHQPQQGYAGGDNPPDREQSVSQLSISDVEANILEIILDFIYSGNVKPLTNPQILSGVIRASDRFELSDLKAHCFNALMDFMTDENIGNLAVLAYRHRAERNVRLNINDYILRNLANLMKKKSFRDALKTEPDAFFPDEDCM